MRGLVAIALLALFSACSTSTIETRRTEKSAAYNTLSPEEKELIEDGMEDEMLDIMGIHPFDFFRGDDKQLLTGLIRFCRLGSFIIM